MRQLKISKQITNRESESLDKYLQEIGKVDLISADEEVKLAKRIREGDQLVVPFDEALLDLLLRCRDHCMAKPLSQVHGHQGNNLHGLARTGWLLDQDVFGSAADIGHQSHLVGPELL